jgi:hypothetical protein
MPSILVIGGEPQKGDMPEKAAKKKAPAMIGGDEPDGDEEESPGMDGEAQKLEAAKILFPDNPKRAVKALEAFIYACKE